MSANSEDLHNLVATERRKIDEINEALQAVNEGRRGRPRKDGSSDDESQTDKNIIIQLRKVVTLRGSKPVEFQNGEKTHIDPKHAHVALSRHDSYRLPGDKETFAARLGRSQDSFHRAVHEAMTIDLAESNHPEVGHPVKNRNGKSGKVIETSWDDAKKRHNVKVRHDDGRVRTYRPNHLYYTGKWDE